MEVQLNTYSDYLLKVSNEMLIPSSVFSQIPELDSQILDSDPTIYAKIFDTFTNDVIYIAEASQLEEEVEFFGFVYNASEGEFTESFMSLSSLVDSKDTIFPYQFDFAFSPVKLSDLKVY
jgi:hypothetical protein